MQSQIILKSTKKGLKSPLSMIIYGITLSVGGMYYGISVALFNNFAEQFFKKVFNITDPSELKKIESDLAFYFFLGCFLCALFASFLYENIGRLYTYYFIIFLEILNSFLLIFENLDLIIYSRIIAGFCGCFWMFLSHLMIKENVDEKYRSIVANSFFIFLTTGQTLSYALGSSLFLDYWRVVMFLPVFIELPRLFIVIFCFRFKSPVYLYHIIKDEDKKKSAIEKNYEIFYEPETAIIKTELFLADQKKIKKKNNKKIHFLDLFKRKYRKQFFLSCFINFLTQITGINVLTVFSTEIYKDLKLPNPELLTFIMSFFYIIGGIFITSLGNKIGKKKPILIALFLEGVSWSIVIIGYLTNLGYLVVFGSYSFIFFFSIFGGIQYSYIVSFVAPIGISFASIFKWSITILLLKYILGFIDHFGILSAFVFFCIVSFLGFFGMFFLAVDTDGKSDSEILKEFYKEKDN